MEENHIFSILDDNNELIKQALADHRQLSRLFAETEDNAKTLSKIEEELEQHIRFKNLFCLLKYKSCHKRTTDTN